LLERCAQIACDTLEKTVMSEMRELAKRLGARERG
jgi:hypothetical protein